MLGRAMPGKRSNALMREDKIDAWREQRCLERKAMLQKSKVGKTVILG